MSVYFNPDNLGFIPSTWLDDDTYGDGWPQRAVLLTETEEVTFWKVVPPDGKVLGVSPLGRPSWIDIPPASHDEASLRIRANRDNRLERTQWITQRHRDEIEAGRNTTLSADRYVEIQTYRQALRDVPEQAGFPMSVDWPVKPAWFNY